MWCRSAVNRTSLSLLATSRTRSSALSAPTRPCVRGAFCWLGFPLANPLPSIPSAADGPALFGDFAGTTGLSDCPWSCITGVCPWTSRCGLWRHPPGATTGSPGSRARCVRTCSGSLTARDSLVSCILDTPDVAFRFLPRRRRPGGVVFRGSLPGLHVPLSTLRGRPRMTRGRCGLLTLHRTTLAFATPRRFSPAHGRIAMFLPRLSRVVGALVVTVLVLSASPPGAVDAQGKKLKIGVVFDYTGPLAGGGSELQALGAKIMIDHFIKKGGVEGYQIEALYADAQSKPEVAINEAVRLIEQEKVDMLLGFYSSAQCVPVAARIEQLKKFMWITTCISSAVLENRHLKYVFRAQPSGRQFGLMSTDFLAQNAKTKLGKDPKDLRVAIIHEDGAYGVDVSKGNEEGAKKAGFNVVLKEGYSATAPDLAPLVTKLKRARPDVIFHTGYNPDISLFLRQARELGLRFNALIGHGAGYGVYDKLKEALGKDVNYFYNVDPISIWLANDKALKPELLPLIKMVGEEYEKARPGTTVRSAHVGMAASNTYVLMTEVLPRAIKKYGGIDADSLRKAALEVNLPEGGTMLGFGVKFAGEGSAMAGQNERAFPVIVQYVDDKPYLVWPKSQQQRDPVLPLPSSSPYAAE